MRFLVHGVSHSIRGGIEAFLFEMSAHMPGDTVFDYVIEAAEENRTVSLPGEGEVLYIPPKSNMLANLRGWSKLLDARKGIDTAVYFNWYSMAWLFPAMIAKRKGYRVIIHAHNNNLHDVGTLQRLMHRVNRQVQKWMKITRLTNSKPSSRFFFGRSPAKTIYCAIDPDKFAYRADVRQAMREQLSLSDKHVYGFVGRIAYQKNPLFLMDVFREIAKRDEKAAFLVCGEGDLMEETTQRAREHGLSVLFTGSVTNVRDYYQAMDEFVLPSRFEGLGIVLVEAQTAGLPCVASARVIPEDAKLSDLLEFVPLEDGAQQWAQRAVELLARHEGADRSAAAGITAGTRFNIHTEAAVLEQALRHAGA